MTTNKQHPVIPKHEQGVDIRESEFKDKKKLSIRQRKVAELLRTGKHSAADITIALHYSDPRSYIRELREKGVIIHDEWVEADDTRFKRYWA